MQGVAFFTESGHRQRQHAKAYAEAKLLMGACSSLHRIAATELWLRVAFDAMLPALRTSDNTTQSNLTLFLECFASRTNDLVTTCLDISHEWPNSLYF